jgi:hypothetical protein
LNALFDAFTANAINASTAALTVDHLYEAYGHIDEGRQTEMMPLYGVFYPTQLNGTYGLSPMTLITSTSFLGISHTECRIGKCAVTDRSRVSTSPVHASLRAANSAVSRPVYSARMRLLLALVGYSSRESPFKVTPQYDAARKQLWEYAAFMFAGVVEVNDDYGCEVWTRYQA